MRMWVRTSAEPVQFFFYFFYCSSSISSGGIEAVELNLETFRVGGPLPAVASVKARRRRAAAYLGSKPPMWWLQRAAAGGRAALALGIALWFKHGLRAGLVAPIRVDASTRKVMGLSHDQASRGVHALEAAGLVKVQRGGRGRCAEVTLVAVQPPHECSAVTGEAS